MDIKGLDNLNMNVSQALRKFRFNDASAEYIHLPGTYFVTGTKSKR